MPDVTLWNGLAPKQRLSLTKSVQYSHGVRSWCSGSVGLPHLAFALLRRTVFDGLRLKRVGHCQSPIKSKGSALVCGAFLRFSLSNCNCIDCSKAPVACEASAIKLTRVGKRYSGSMILTTLQHLSLTESMQPYWETALRHGHRHC